MHLAFGGGGVRDTTLVSKPYSFEALAQRLSTPQIGPKDGSHLIRGGHLAKLTRSDESLLSAELLILDGDSTIDRKTGEITPGAPDPDDVAAVLDTMGLNYIWHTTHSNAPGVSKYRFYIPAKLPDQATLDACVSEVFEILHQRGVWLNDVSENRRWSQAWYLPRVPDQEALDRFQSRAVTTSRPYNVARAVAKAEKRNAEAAILKAAQLARAEAPRYTATLPNQAESVIDTFNAQHGLEYVRGTLESKGYTYSHQAGETYRYLRPGSETGIAGVVIFKGDQGHWLTYSHHGAADPLSERVCDPFELYATLEHGGNKSAAAKWLITESSAAALSKIKKSADILPIRPTATAEPVSLPVDDVWDEPEPEFKQPPEITPILSTPAPATTGLKITLGDDLTHKSTKWLIKGLLPAGGMAAIYGKPGAYKSFVALYLAAGVATGNAVFGRPTTQGDTLYIAGEGHHGIKDRFDALKTHQDLQPGTRLGFIQQALDFRSSPDDLVKLIDAINATDLKPVLVIIDTLFRAFSGGNENSSEDMGAFISIVGALHQSLGGCAILIVHHCGKDEARGLRGHSSLLAALDTELEVTKTSLDGIEPRTGQIHCSKMKDADDGWDEFYKVPLISLPSTVIAEPRSSLALEPCSPNEAPQRPKATRAAPKRDLALEALTQALIDHGQPTILAGVPHNARTVHKEVWRKAFYRTWSGEQPAAQKAFVRAIDKLQTESIAGVCDDLCWIIGSPKSETSFDEF